MRSSTRVLLLVPAFLTGFAALGLEMLWIQRIEYRFGNTASAAGIVIAVFFLSAAAGNLLGGWWSRHCRNGSELMRRWAFAAVLAGLCAAGCWAFSDWTAGWHAILGTLWLAGPTSILLGVSFPLLGGLSALGRASLTPHAGLVYGAELVGATVAIGVAGVWWPVVWSYTTALWMVCALLVVIPLAFLWVPFDARMETPDLAPVPQRSPVALPAWLLVAASGFLTLSFEMIAIDWVRHLSGFAIQTYLLVLLLFLGGLALGTGLATLLRRRGWQAEKMLMLALIGSGLWIGVATAGVQWLIQRGDAVGEVSIRTTAASVAFILPAVVLCGMPFPLAWDLAQRKGAAGALLGGLTSLNKLAAAAGALATVFLAIPMFGIQTTALLIALGFVALALVMIFRKGLVWRIWRPVPIGLAGLLLVGLFQPWHPIHLRDGSEMLGIDYGAYGSVAVIERDRRSRHIVLDNAYTLNGTSEALQSQRNQSWIPLALTETRNPRVLIIGMGSGISAEAALDFPVASLEVVELVPEVVGAARDWFEPWNARLFEDPRVDILATDGRLLLTNAAPDQKWDVIICDLFLPQRAGARYFYTASFFEEAKRHLAEDGLFCLWLPVYQWRDDWMQSLLLPFRSVFPGARLIRGNLDPLQPILGLIAAPDRQWEASLARRSLPDRVALSGDLFFRSPANLNLIEIAPLAAWQPEHEPRPIADDSLWFTWAAGLAGSEGQLRGNRLLHWISATFGTERSETPLARAARAGNHSYAAMVQSVRLDRGNDAERAARAAHHWRTAAALYPEGRF